jgi:hypothetical protein
MSDKVGLVRVLTAATGNSTPITLGARYSDLFMTPADAGAVDGRTYTWLIVDGNNWELVKGVYTASGTTAARTTVLASRSAGTLGTSRIVLSGTAQVRIVESSYDMDGVRGTRTVAGTSDTLASTDLGYVVTYGNAAAVAVSLAQAGTASLYDGWATWVQNTGVGTVTITPATSTVNGASTLPLATNMGAFIWSDGTNYHAYFVPVSKPLLAANNLADVASASTALGNLGGAASATTISGGGLVTGGGSLAANRTVTVTAAAKTDQQTSTSNALAVTPLHQQDHPSAAKAWVKFAGSGTNGAQTISASYNVSGVSRTSMGVYTITFTTPFASADYVCTGSEMASSTNGWAQFTSPTTGSVGINFITISGGSNAVYDPGNAMAVCFGAQ